MAAALRGWADQYLASANARYGFLRQLCFQLPHLLPYWGLLHAAAHIPPLGSQPR